MCGVAGMVLVRNHNNLGKYLYASLYNLQHRGKEEAGIAVWQDGKTTAHVGPGTIDRVFINFDLSGLQGSSGVAHNLYSTSGGSVGEPLQDKHCADFQPMFGNFRGKKFVLSYNGNLVDIQRLKRMIIERRSELAVVELVVERSDVDTALIIELIESSDAESFEQALRSGLPSLSGAFSMIFLYDGNLYVVRDRLGFRPLFICQFRDGVAVASETCAFSSLPKAGKPIMMARGGIAVISKDHPYRYEVELWHKNFSPGRFCMFEYIYFARPDSYLGEERAIFIQERLGRELAREAPCEADIVLGVPDSGINAARGYADELSLTFKPEAIFRPHTVGRTFIDPVQGLRNEGIRFKHFVIDEMVKGKRVIVIDDSIVRGNTIPRIITLLLEAGAKEVHIRISSPPYRNPCYFGIDTWRVKGELIARNFNGDVSKICKEIGANSLAYLSLNGAKSAWRGSEGLCDACFSGKYPIPVI